MSSYKRLDFTVYSYCNILTWKVAPETRLGSDHPLCSGFTKDCNVVLRLLPQSCQSIAKQTDFIVQVIVGEPSILS